MSTYVIVNVAVRDGNPLAGVGHIDQAVVVVLVMVQVAGQINMVNPDVVRCLNRDSITVVSEDLADLQVSHNDIGLLVDGQTNAGESCGRVFISHATQYQFPRGKSCTYSCQTFQ